MTSSADRPRLLVEQLDATARAFPEHLAIVHGDRRLTWAQVAAESIRLAGALLARGIGRGDNVALWLPNRPEWLLLWLAAVRIGAVVVPVNTRYKPDEAAYVLRRSDARLLVTVDEFLGVDHRAAFAEICPDWTADGGSPALPALRDVVVIGNPGPHTAFDGLLAGAAAVAPQRVAEATAAAGPDERVIIVFTSGTTGFPKGVLHTHDAVRMAQTVADWLDLGPADRVLGHLPLFHVAGVFSSFLLALVGGGALIQMDRWEPAAALDLIEAERVSVLSGIPTHFVDLLSLDVRGRDLTSLRTGWIGGSYIPPDVVRGARDVLGMTALLPVYGMTETTSCTTLGRADDPEESLLLGKGVPLGGYEVAVVDPENRRPVPAGEVGEVAVRGYTVMKGYYADPEATAAVLDADGWFHTGDLGAFDERGYLRITGRRSDMFIVGGNNVHPADVERVLLEHERIKAAHVVARPDPRLGEVGVAFVEPVDGQELGAADVLAHATARLASFKVPRAVQVLHEWPLTPTGKVRTDRLRELAAEVGS